ncbi:MAG TPA: hypothetical protein VGZ00_11765 [Candidatus Baltobacteraceae bacterium]|jgi:hypothetical protein|nr:hypothetical protein [Candidatus Baltobacteraceae bacterium]
MNKYFLAALAVLTLAAPVAAQADMPSYAQPPPMSQDEQVRGRVVNFDGGYSLSVRDERGFVDNVRLHPGTIINPTGITIAPGMVVSIVGYNAGDFFAANEVDTPYTYYGGVPYYLGHPWDYYGPSVDLGFYFGRVGWWHGNYFRGGYQFNRGARVYADVRVSNVYRHSGGSFQGRNYVAPREHGGYYNEHGTGGHDRH